MIKNAKMIVATLLAAAVAIGASGCNAGPSDADPSPTPSSRPVTIAAPPSANPDQVALRLTGPVGEELDVYAFSSGWSKKAPGCTETGDPVRSVKIGNSGAETVKVSLDSAGVWWWVVASVTHGTTSKCGAVSTTVKTAPEFAFGGPNSPTESLNGYEGELPAGEPVKFWVVSDSEAPKPVGDGWPVTVRWIGPFGSTPEARAGCQNADDQTAITEDGTATPDEPGQEFSVTPKEPGVYAVTASTPESDWNAAVTTGCDDSTPLLVVE